MYEYIHDDKTWCFDDECTYIQCERNIANRLTKGGMYSAANFKDTTICPLYKKEHTWVEVHGYCTAGGDPVWTCPKCHGTEHVYGTENNNPKETCEQCGQRNYYPWELTT